jgi:hypothetical protein
MVIIQSPVLPYTGIAAEQPVLERKTGQRGIRISSAMRTRVLVRFRLPDTGPEEFGDKRTVKRYPGFHRHSHEFLFSSYLNYTNLIVLKQYF